MASFTATASAPRYVEIVGSMAAPTSRLTARACNGPCHGPLVATNVIARPETAVVADVSVSPAAAAASGVRATIVLRAIIDETRQSVVPVLSTNAINGALVAWDAPEVRLVASSSVSLSGPTRLAAVGLPASMPHPEVSQAVRATGPSWSTVAPSGSSTGLASIAARGATRDGLASRSISAPNGGPIYAVHGGRGWSRAHGTAAHRTTSSSRRHTNGARANRVPKGADATQVASYISDLEETKPSYTTPVWLVLRCLSTADTVGRPYTRLVIEVHFGWASHETLC